ncbi:MAG: DegT/DnrJ/EryC1/StrS family aminotransferase [Flavobacteriales bacterium]|nr:DegT/DnrJ/EryC1/StrS family aminotransferase [Flavobacteriales bacterium]MCB9499643.1 DegT/DnrJ/EryC1/StrS family aminotransferase [Erysipelotrichaceae bacterium]
MSKRIKNKNINVTKTFLPPFYEYDSLIQKIWKNEWLTNRGDLLKELEKKLKKHLKVSNIIVMTNGTLPIQIALKFFGNNGEIITTPFSYVATTSSIVWENCTPVFVDIHPEYLTIDETKIEAAITPKTTAILATHVYGNPCNVDVIEKIAKKHHLKVIYDAAHGFGVTFKNQSIFNYGDVSTCSFHATKLFHTGEGGAIFCKGDDLYKEFFYRHNFGHNGPLNFHGVGINAKISELQAAMGLAVLPHIDFIIQERKKVVDYYNSHLNFSRLTKLKIREHTNWNYSYYPVIFENEEKLLEVESQLNKNNIFPRRYFNPALNTLPYINFIPMPIAESISKRIICLPLYVGLTTENLKFIIHIINKQL